jgi:hypothetical protein
MVGTCCWVSSGQTATPERQARRTVIINSGEFPCGNTIAGLSDKGNSLSLFNAEKVQERPDAKSRKAISLRFSKTTLCQRSYNIECLPLSKNIFAQVASLYFNGNEQAGSQFLAKTPYFGFNFLEMPLRFAL